MPYGYAIPGIWVFAASQYQTGLVYPAFLTREQQARLERIRQARMLFDGKHRQYFFEEERTQFDFPPAIAGYRVTNPYMKYNALGLISWKGTDLLLGAPPIIKVKNSAQQAALEELRERTSFHSMIYDAAVSCSYEAESYVECCIQGGQVYCMALDTTEVFPVGCQSPGGQFSQYQKLRMKNIGTDDQPLQIMLQELYSAGSITRQLWQLGQDGRKQKELDLKYWPVEEGQIAPEPITRTGITENTITFIPNQLSRGKVISDYDIAIDLQDALNASHTQLSMLIAKHADPTLQLPTRFADDQGNARANNKVLFVDDAESIKYLTWDGQISAALANRDFHLHNLLVSTETSPVLLGLKEGSHNDAYKKVKVQAMSALKKGERKSVFWQMGIKRILTVAQMMEQTIPGMRYDIEPIGVSLRDGIPMDELDEANKLSILRAAGLMSLQRGVEQQIDDPAAAAQEIAEIQSENEQQTPQILLGKPVKGGGPGAQETTTEVEDESEAAERDELEEVAA